MGFAPIFYFRDTMQAADELIESVAGGLGFEVVDIERANGGRLLRVFIDKPEGVNIDDCTLLSNQLTRVFMVEDIDYDRLEVSSPGLDRVVKREQDFLRFVGERMRVTLKLPIEGRTRVLVGVLTGCVEGRLTIQVDQKLHTVELSNVEKARLVPVF